MFKDLQNMPDSAKEPFAGLAEAIQAPDIGVYCPGADCFIIDGDAVAEFGDRVLDVLSGPTYDIGTLLPRTSLSQDELARMVENRRYRLPDPVCAVHFECPYGGDVLREIMLLEQIGEKIGVTMFTSLADEWSLIPLTLMIDPENLPLEDQRGSADCFELDGFDVDVTDLEGLDDAMSVQTEFLHRVIEAIAPDKPRLH